MLNLLYKPLDWATKRSTRIKRFLAILASFVWMMLVLGGGLLSLAFAMVMLIQTGYVHYAVLGVGISLVGLIAWGMSKEDWS